MICTSALDRPLRIVSAPRGETAALASTQWAATTTDPTDTTATTDTAQRLLTGGNSESLLSISYSRRAGYTLVGLAGQMDVTTCDLLRRTLVRLLAQTGPRLVIDMGEVTFTDARGISPLVTAQRLAGESGGWVRLARVYGRVVRTVLDIGRLAAVLPAYATVADAAAGTGMTFYSPTTDERASGRAVVSVPVDATGIRHSASSSGCTDRGMVNSRTVRK